MKYFLFILLTFSGLLLYPQKIVSNTSDTNFMIRNVHVSIVNFLDFNSIQCIVYKAPDIPQKSFYNYYNQEIRATEIFQNGILKKRISYKNGVIRSEFFIDTVYTRCDSSTKYVNIYYEIIDSAIYYSKKGKLKTIYIYNNGFCNQKCTFNKQGRKCAPFNPRKEFPYFRWHFFRNKIINRIINKNKSTIYNVYPLK
jgi:antitoxin component YwqK of YwqJK toxin-antitoxin module